MLRMSFDGFSPICFPSAFLFDAYLGGFSFCDLTLDLYRLAMVAFDASTTFLIVILFSNHGLAPSAIRCM